MTEYAITTEHLSRSFKTIKAVDDLSLQVPAGTVFGFLGSNEAGKTTTIHMLLGLLEPTADGTSVLGFDMIVQEDGILEEIRRGYSSVEDAFVTLMVDTSC